MAKTTQITCTTDALSHAADALLQRPGPLSKNAVLNALAAAIAGPGHDWGFLKNAPAGTFTQPGVKTQAAPEAPELWCFQMDEREDWASAPLFFASKQDALDYMRKETFWRSPYDNDRVLSLVEETGSCIIPSEELVPGIDEEVLYNADAYEVRIFKVEVEKPATATPAQDGPEARDALCDTVVLFDQPDGHPEQGLYYETLFASMDDLTTFLKNRGIDRDDYETEISKLRDLAEITAEIRPEAWVKDDAMAVDPEGETEWLIHPHEVDPAEGDLDYLKQSLNAPAWVKAWTGPFTITLTFSEKSWDQR